MKKDVLNGYLKKKIVTAVNYTDCKWEHQAFKNTIKKNESKMKKRSV